MKMKLPIEISNMDSDHPHFIPAVAQILNSLIGIINGEISFTDNCKTTFVSVSVHKANTEQAVRHTLNRTPMGYILVGSKDPTTVYNGVTPNTPSILYLQASAVTTVNLLIF